MALGRLVKPYDVAYVEALAGDYPDATPDELAAMTYRSASTIARIIDGWYSGVKTPQTPSKAVHAETCPQLRLDYDSGLKSQINALTDSVNGLVDRLAYLERELGLEEK